MGPSQNEKYVSGGCVSVNETYFSSIPRYCGAADLSARPALDSPARTAYPESVPTPVLMAGLPATRPAGRTRIPQNSTPHPGRTRPPAGRLPVSPFGTLVMPDTPATLYLLDTHALIYQMFHAVPPMTAPDGRPTNAVFGVTRDLLNIADEVKPTYLLSTFDPPEPTFRNEICADYKAHREPPPPDLSVQVPMVHAVLEAMNLPVLRVPGYEADDIMATIATAAAAKGVEVTLCTTDKDCRQLIGDRVKMLNLR